MNRQVPIEGQKVEVRLEDGDWQDAVYAHEVFTDSYGLPLDSGKIREWRAIATGPRVNGAGQVPRGASRPAGQHIQ